MYTLPSLYPNQRYFNWFWILSILSCVVGVVAPLTFLNESTFSGKNLSTNPEFQADKPVASDPTLLFCACAPIVTWVAKSLVNSVLILKSVTNEPWFPKLPVGFIP